MCPVTKQWAPRGFRGRNQIKRGGSLLEAGTHVRVIDAIPGWGEALDRFGVIETVSLAHYKCYVRTASHSGWVRVEDLVSVPGDAK